MSGWYVFWYYLDPYKTRGMNILFNLFTSDKHEYPEPLSFRLFILAYFHIIIVGISITNIRMYYLLQLSRPVTLRPAYRRCTATISSASCIQIDLSTAHWALTSSAIIAYLSIPTPCNTAI